MIVPTMTDLEIIAEIEKDYPEVYALTKKLDKSPVYKKRLQWGKPKDGMFTFIKENWKTCRGNVYTIIFSAADWSELKKLGFRYCVFTYLQRNNSLNAIRTIVFGDGDMGIEILTSHFIDRYNQRFLKQPFLPRKELFLEFLKRNPQSVFHNLNSSKYDYGTMAAVHDGYIFGKQEHDKVIIAKTFLSRDMLFGEQYDGADLLDEVLAKSVSGEETNIINADVLLEETNKKDKSLPTVYDYNKVQEMLAKIREKEARLEYEGKSEDLELVEMKNSLSIWASGFDWLGAQLKDNNGQLLDLSFLLQ